MLLSYAVFIIYLQPEEGSQFYIEIIDDDFGASTNELVDRFAINVTTPVGTTSDRETYPGVFAVATMDMSFRVICINNYCGPNCDVFCLDNDTCDPGFTGEFCAMSIDDCAEVSCGFNKMCVDTHLNYTCECVPGYTGSNCTMDINECERVDCNNGNCMDGLNSFQCNCDPGFTGTFCETRLDGYELQVTVYSFINPDDGSTTFLCCDSDSCNIIGCHYFFSYCLRPAGSQVSYTRRENRGNCASIDTTAEERFVEGRNFTDMVFNIPNPLIPSGVQWVSENKIIFYARRISI